MMNTTRTVEVGRCHQQQARVDEWMTAEAAGNRGVAVLSTPSLMRLIEEAAMHCLEPFLGSDEISVSTYFDLSHLGATPVGLLVTTEVEVITVSTGRIEFAVGAFDEREKIAEGTHERAILRRNAFVSRFQEKRIANE